MFTSSGLNVSDVLLVDVLQAYIYLIHLFQMDSDTLVPPSGHSST